MLTNDPHPLISLLVITAAVLITYPLATRMTDALRPHFETFLDRRDARRYKFDPRDKHLTDAETAAEWWQEVDEHTRTAAQVLYEKTALGNPYVMAHFKEVGERCSTLHRFATRPFDEEVQAHLGISPDSTTPIRKWYHISYN